MTLSDSKIEARMPVWTALSELFLDAELWKEDYDYIAGILAASPYSEEKLEEILRFEVTPVLKCNLMSIAGVWDGFDEDWLREKLTPRIDQRPFFRFEVLDMMRGEWKEIRRMVAALRA